MRIFFFCKNENKYEKKLRRKHKICEYPVHPALAHILRKVTSNEMQVTGLVYMCGGTRRTQEARGDGYGGISVKQSMKQCSTKPHVRILIYTASLFPVILARISNLC